MAEKESTSETDGTLKMPRHQRYYALHREQELARDKERYNNRPEVIAKREERERKKAEKQAEKDAKRIEKERIRQEKLATALATALATKRKTKNEHGGLDAIVGVR